MKKIIYIIVLTLLLTACITELKIYPNPASEIINIENIEYYSKIEIYDIQGQLLISIDNPNNPININNLKIGSYFIRTYSNQDMGTGKFIKRN